MGQHGYFSPGVGRGQGPAPAASTTGSAPATQDFVDNKYLLRDCCRVVPPACKIATQQQLDFKEQECLEKVLQCRLCLRRIIYLLRLPMEVKVLHFVMFEELYFQSQWFECVFTTGSPLRNKAGDILFYRLLLIQWKNAIS